ncbi:hypothetical protein [Xanthomonas cannabis]|nr:hypothetical protein [Xanthomonas cannabis]NIK19512.1 hypothetical protein [Xanthomonas cannabis]
MTEILIILAVLLVFGLFTYSRVRRAKAKSSSGTSVGGGSSTTTPNKQIR